MKLSDLSDREFTLIQSVRESENPDRLLNALSYLIYKIHIGEITMETIPSESELLTMIQELTPQQKEDYRSYLKKIIAESSAD